MYADRAGLDEEMNRAFVSIMVRMDEGFVEWQNEKRDRRRRQQREEAEKAAAGKESGRTRGPKALPKSRHRP